MDKINMVSNDRAEGWGQRGFVASTILFGLMLLGALAVVPVTYVVNQVNTENRSKAVGAAIDPGAGAVVNVCATVGGTCKPLVCAVGEHEMGGANCGMGMKCCKVNSLPAGQQGPQQKPAESSPPASQNPSGSSGGSSGTSSGPNCPKSTCNKSQVGNTQCSNTSKAERVSTCKAIDVGVSGCPRYVYKWETKKCGSGKICRGGKCIDENMTGVCDVEVEASRCKEGKIQYCVNNNWGLPQVCSAGKVCDAGKCVKGPAGGGTECTPVLDAECVTTTNIKYCKTDGTWADSEPCPVDTPYCVNNKCVKGECDPGQTQCVDGNTFKTCRGDGTWGPAANCTSPGSSNQRVCDLSVDHCVDLGSRGGWVDGVCKNPPTEKGCPIEAFFKVKDMVNPLPPGAGEMSIGSRSQ